MACLYKIVPTEEERDSKAKMSVKRATTENSLRKNLLRSRTKAPENFLDKQNTITFFPAQNYPIMETELVSTRKWNTTIMLDRRKFFVAMREWKCPMKSNSIMVFKKRRFLKYWKDIPGLAVCHLHSPNKMEYKRIPISPCHFFGSDLTSWQIFFKSYRPHDFPIKYLVTLIGDVYFRSKDCALKYSQKGMSRCNAISNSIKKLGIIRRRFNYDIRQRLVFSCGNLLTSEFSEEHKIEFDRKVQIDRLELLESKKTRIFSLDGKVARILSVR